MTGRTWAFARTLLAVGGLLFCGVSLGLACLDYAGEPDPSACGAAVTTGGSGSGVADGGSDTSAPDCGTPDPGSGSAAP